MARLDPRASASLLPLCLGLFLGAGCTSPAPAAEPPPRIARAPLVQRVPRRAPYDVEHYALELELYPAERALRGLARVRLIALEALDEVVLDLEGLAVDEVQDAEERVLGFAHERGRLAVRPAEPLAPGGRLELAIRYGGVPRKGLWFSGERDGLPTQVFTQGECEDARWWFPCFDEPHERATSELVVDLPRAWRAVAAGERVEREERGERARERWRMHHAHPSYLMTLVAGELLERESRWDGVPLLFLGPPELEEHLEPTFARTGEILGFLSKLTGVRYPYPKYSQACVDNFPFGGMENVSATTLGQISLRDERGRRDRPPEGLIAHEAAHQWFGDLLTCASWPEIWLNEGFATYATALWLEESEGADHFRAKMREIQEAYVERDRGPDRRAILHDRYREPMELFFSGHVYQGGAARLHLLRYVLGEQAFRRGLRSYVARNAGRAVTTEDLRLALEEASGRDLRDFFEQWFRRPGHPELETRWRHDAGRGRLSLAVRQVQEVADGTPEVFRVPLEVEIRDVRGKRRVRLELSKRQEIFDLECEERPTWVRFDKGGWLPKVLRDRKEPEEWLALAAEDDDANGRLDAVAALGELARGAPSVRARERVVAALVERLAGDPVPLVRERAARALAGTREAAARAALLRAAGEDLQASVRVAALDSLAACGPEAEHARFAAEAWEACWSWRTAAAAAALELAAATDPAEALERYLARLDGAGSPHGALEAALLERLAGRSEPAVLARLHAFAQDAARPSEARAAALRALARSEPSRAELQRVLLARLAERDVHVRRAALEALGEVVDPTVTRILAEEHARSVDLRERRALEAALGLGEEPRGASR